MSNISDNINFDLPQNTYINFDALTLKDFIIDRLDTSGKFTDQIYDGSNLSSIIEIIAYSYHVLMFYLNTTASESTFSQASLYENMNKIVNLVGYKPTGRQTSMCSINAVADNTLPIANYTIRKYSYFLVDGVQYTFNTDYSFSKTTSETESLETLNENVILYQGTVQQYPTYIAAGEEYETIPVVVDNIIDTDDTRFISNGTISVYVKEKSSGTYFEYKEASSLYLAKSFDRVYDLRLNENGNYEVKFGNGIFGKNLASEDEVVIYYILSDNTRGIISKNAINGNKLFTYTTQTFENIYTDIASIDTSTLLTNEISQAITFTNPINSTNVSKAETVDEIRKNTPKFVATNQRLVTTTDYTSFLEKNLNNLIHSIYVASNKAFIDEYINYFYQISVDPTKINRVLLNQVNFADSCDFNNVNVFCVPSFVQVADGQVPNYLSTSFKNLIIDLTKESKMIGAEVVPRDPVYMAFKLGISNRTLLTSTIANSCKLVVVRENTNKIRKDILKTRVTEIIRDFFTPINNNLGQQLKLSNLASQILSIAGVKSIKTTNVDENIDFEGISFIVWNPAYESDDISILNQDTTLPFFKFPYLDYPLTLSNYIEVIDE